jgi:hypothetical protein
MQRARGPDHRSYVAPRTRVLHVVPDPVPAAGETPPLDDRIERLIAECVTMRDRAARTTWRTRALVSEARRLLEDARAQRTRDIVPSAMLPRRAIR